jgi:hypothetical protein
MDAVSAVTAPTRPRRVESIIDALVTDQALQLGCRLASTAIHLKTLLRRTYASL